MKTCIVDGCDKPNHARGLCSTHYNQRYQPGRHCKVTVPCGWCEQPCEKEPGRTERYGKVFCSLACRDAWRKAEGVALGPPRWWHERMCVIPPNHPVRWLGSTCAITYTRCRHCAACIAHDARSTRVFCSRQCRARAKEASRQGRHQIRRQSIYERDRWVCQVCHTRTAWTKVVPHPRAPTTDHIIPQAEGIDHDPANLRTAHFKCNSERGDRGGDEQLALVG